MNYKVMQRPMFKLGGKAASQGTGITSGLDEKTNYSIGGGVIQGQNMGAREGFQDPSFSNMSLEELINMKQKNYNSQMSGLGDMRDIVKLNALGQLVGNVLPNVERGGLKGVTDFFRDPGTTQAALQGLTGLKKVDLQEKKLKGAGLDSYIKDRIGLETIKRGDEQFQFKKDQALKAGELAERKLDIAEKRLPQDGRLALKIGEHTIDVRISTLPSNHGERIVMRVLDKKSASLNLEKLGLSNNNLEKMQALIKHPHGIILVTGPTGSGKTTSLYAMLNSLNNETRNILTIEDPIEYDLPGIGQTQVNTKIDMSFATGLRAILRQDPDIVMIGEIRDKETANIAVQASLTGHLVLSTLHTNSALGALTRLHDMGVESFLLSSSMVGLIAQRLVRKLCPDCKKPHALRDDERQRRRLDGQHGPALRSDARARPPRCSNGGIVH